jgi:hypothetical protein
MVSLVASEIKGRKGKKNGEIRGDIWKLDRSC